MLSDCEIGGSPNQVIDGGCCHVMIGHRARLIVAYGCFISEPALPLKLERCSVPHVPDNMALVGLARSTRAVDRHRLL